MAKLKKLRIASCNVEKNVNPDRVNDLVTKNDIIMLQEIYPPGAQSIDTMNDISVWYGDWSKCCIVLNNRRQNLDVINNSILGQSNWYYDLLIHIGLINQTILLVSVYFPQSKNKQQQLDLILSLMVKIEQLDLTNIELIISGDFNFTINPTIDHSSQNTNFQEDEQRELMEAFILSASIKDIFRMIEPDMVNFTNFPNSEGMTCRRLDRIYISDYLSTMVSGYWQKTITPIFTSHDSIGVNIISDGIVHHRKKNRFRIPNHLIYDDLFLLKMKQIQINNWKSYTKLVKNYVLKNTNKPTDSESQNFNLMKVIQKRINKNPNKRNTINQLVSEDGESYTTTKQILHHAGSYYLNLFKADSQPRINSEYLQDIESFISDEERDELEKNVSLEEIKDALNSLNQSAPGEDGIPYELIQHHWDITAPLLQKEIMKIFNENKILKSLQKILILLIKKKGDSKNISNYRPIAIANTSIRILSKVVNNRISKVVDNLLHKDIHGFVSSRNIINCTNKFNILFERAQKTKGVAIISLDITKAFDNVSNGLIKVLLKTYGFGERIVNFILSTSYDMTAKINIDNNHSDEINFLKGVRQGLPTSPLIFLLIINLLIIKFSKQLRGFDLSDEFPFYNQSIKVGNLAFADDIIVTVYEDEIDKFKKILKDFERISFLKINQTKTNVFTNDPELFQTLGLNYLTWNNPDNFYLGVPLNFQTRAKFIAGLGIYGLTITDKVKVINLYLLTKFIHKDILNTFSKNELSTVEKLIQIMIKYVAKKTLYANKHQGGFGLMSLQILLGSIRAKRVYSILFDDNINNWDILYMRLRIQTFLFSDSRSMGVPWYQFLITRNVMEFKFNTTDFFTSTEKLTIKSWLNLTVNERPIVDFQQQDVNYNAITIQIFNLKGGASFFQGMNKKYQNQFGLVVPRKSWSKLLTLTDKHMIKIFKEVSKLSNVNSLIGECIHRFYLGHFNFYYQNTLKCKLCGENFSNFAIGSDQHKNQVLRHRYARCLKVKHIWSLLAYPSKELTIELLFEVSSGDELIIKSRFIDAVNQLEIYCKDNSEALISNSDLETWVNEFKIKYKKKTGF